mmetsp:Transcript_12731/g.45076  ORF Transcript_12731/g.45076 Transcript_12731/m.45076 type:complete len:200 (+) Transcript_12731:2923-3522(+)
MLLPSPPLLHLRLQQRRRDDQLGQHSAPRCCALGSCAHRLSRHSALGRLSEASCPRPDAPMPARTRRCCRSPKTACRPTPEADGRSRVRPRPMMRPTKWRSARCPTCRSEERRGSSAKPDCPPHRSHASLHREWSRPSPECETRATRLGCRPAMRWGGRQHWCTWRPPRRPRAAAASTAAAAAAVATEQPSWCSMRQVP